MRNSNFHSLLILSISICIFTLWISTGKLIQSSNYDIDHTFSLPTTTTTNNKKEVNFCPGIWNYYSPNNRTYLEKLYWEAYEYHNLGGNLEALEHFLNNAIGETYDKRGFSPFVFNDNTESNQKQQSVPDEIISTLRKQDNGNGGYYLRKLPGKFTGTMANQDNNGRFVNVLDPQTHERWDIALGPTLPQDSFPCIGFKVLGNGYEQKYICGWQHEPFQGVENETTSQEECNVVSIGSNDQWGFENQMVKTKCNVATFDCTVTHPKNKPDSEQVQFYSQCISHRKESYSINNRQYNTYFDLINAAGFTNNNHTSSSRINYMKMDVEGYEYGVITNMIRYSREHDLMHLLPDQLQLEFHYATWMYDLPWSLRTRTTGELVAFFSMLFREAGYVAVHFENQRWPTLREILFLRVYC